MLNQIEKGDMPSSADLKGCLGYAAAILENVCKTEQEMRYSSFSVVFLTWKLGNFH